MNAPEILKIHPEDNVVVAITDLKAGAILELDGESLVLLNDIPCAHKIALKAFVPGDLILKYGMPIGEASSEIKRGEHVHCHNVKTQLSGQQDYEYKPNFTELAESKEKCFFDGYIRPDGEVGIRNDIWIIPTVGCVNMLAMQLAQAVTQELPEGITDAIALTHPYGCSQLGDDHEMTAEILAALARHPNAGGVLIVALGCENNTLESFKQRLSGIDNKKVRYLKAQDAGEEFERGLELIEELEDYAKTFKREKVPVSKLKVGLKCGGSDGFSGITGNPLIGRFSDWIVGQGGTSVLTEVPEMFGAETILMNRCRTPEIFKDCVKMINNFKAYFESYNQPVFENPSPGNKDGGITTLEDKSLGCTQKGGNAPVSAVLDYAEQVKVPGLNLLTGPGNDMVAVTVLAAAGVQLVLFSTGRGTPFGGPIPTVKIATNSELAKNKTNWIDFDAGRLLTGGDSDKLDKEFVSYILDLASGKKLAKNEEQGYQEIAIFKDGVTL